MGFEILRIAKLKNMGDVARSAKHTFRDFETPNAIPDRLDQNKIEWAWEHDFKISPAEKVIQEVNRVCGLVDKRDKQAVPCIEYLVTASKETMQNIDSAAYLDDALKWIRAKHGADNVVCSVVHHDEQTPHLVAYVVPVAQIEEKVRKRSVNVKGAKLGFQRETIEQVVPAHTLLSAKHYFGGKDKLAKLQTEFHEAVGVKHGLERGISRTDRRHIKPAEWYAQERVRMEAEKKELEALRANLDKDLLKLAEEKTFLTEQHSRMSAELRNRGLDLDRREETLADDLKHLERITRGQENTKAGLEQREQSLDDRKTAMDALEQDRAVKIAAVKDSLKQREDAIEKKTEAVNALAESVQAKQEKYKTEVIEPFYEQRTAFRTLTQGHTPDQIAGALTVIEATKKKGIDMDHLTQGDCVIILGKTWAEKKGIRTAEDMMKPASPEDAAWARRVGLPKPKPDNQTQGVKR